MKMTLCQKRHIPTVAMIGTLMLAGCVQDALVDPDMPNTTSPVPMLAKSADMSAAGGFTVTNAAPIAIASDDRSCDIDLLATFKFIGSLEGAFTAVFEIEHAGPCDQPATEKFEVMGTYEGSVAGVSGSYPFEFEGTIDEEGHAVGFLEMEAGSVEVKLELRGTAGVSGTYSGHVKVDD